MSVFVGHSHREEYVEEDGGLMFRGVYNRIKPTPWNYAHYEKDILECAIYLVREIGKVCTVIKISECVRITRSVRSMFQ